MADRNRKRVENVPGTFFVDETCIDCGMCYWMSPGVFTEVGDLSAVTRQPQSEEEIFRSAQALVSCPVGSIGQEGLSRDVLNKAIHSFPDPLAGDVYLCGYHSPDSFGATSYLILRSEGNVLVDSPRFVPQLVKRIEALGGIRYLFLTHRDDVADHKKFQAHFGCERILHEADVSSETRDVEIKLTGRDATKVAPDLVVIPVPGHTRGHAVLLHKHFLFTGDHLAWLEERGELTAFRDVCWYSWSQQTESMKKLRAYDFEWVLPGHGVRHHANVPEMKASLDRCIAWMETRS